MGCGCQGGKKTTNVTQKRASIVRRLWEKSKIEEKPIVTKRINKP